jgi:uncharacterized protein
MEHEMSRLLLIIAVAIVVYLLIRSFRKAAPKQHETLAAEDMVRCAHCGVHLPKGESVQADGRFFCNAEHRDACRK